MGVVYNPDRNTLIPISTVSGEITYLTAGLIYEKMQTCLIIGTEVTYLKHYPDQDIYLADYSYIQGGWNGAIFSNRAQRDPYSYFHRWNPNTQEFVIRAGVSLNLSNVTKNGIMYFYFPNDNAYTILAYDYNRLFFNNVEEIKATVRVNYYLPDYDYTYAKITYKKDDKPASETDGTSVNILKDQSSVDIPGLEIGGNYWFTVFTDKSESEAFPFLVPEIIDYGNMIFNDNSEITAARSSYTASTTPKFLVDMYKEKSTQSGYAYMNPSANTWLIGPANNANGYSAIFGWTLPTNKDIYIICQNDTGQNAYYVWIWWDGFTSRDMLGTNCGYYKEINVQSNGTISQYQASTAINCYSGFSNNLTIDSNRYWSQTWLGGSATLKPIVWTEVSTSRIWVNGKKLT